MLATPLPEHLDVDLSARCNLRCRFCHLSTFEPRDRSQEIRLAAFDRHFGALLPTLKKLTLFSKFEPLAARDFIPIFRRIAPFDMEIHLSTNGILLEDDVLEVLLGRLDLLTVSLTGFDRERYRHYMRSDAFEIVQGNLLRLMARKRSRGTQRPRLRISTVAMQSTLEELPRALDFAHRYEASEGVQVTALHVFDAGGMAEMPLEDLDRYRRLTERAQVYADKLGVKLELPGIPAARPACGLPWHGLSVQPNGDVYPCPVAYAPVGTLKRQSLPEIWAGSALAGFRAGVNDPSRMNTDCRTCIHGGQHDLSNPAASDFSRVNSFIGGMRRRPLQIRRLRRAASG